MSTNTIWLLTAMTALFALGIVGVVESQIPATAFWIGVGSLLSLLTLWKYMARRDLARQGNLELTAEELETVKPTAYLWLGAYFFFGFGFVAMFLASLYYRFSIPVGVVLTFFAAWWIRFETWAFVLHRTRETSQMGQVSNPLDAIDQE